MQTASRDREDLTRPTEEAGRSQSDDDTATHDLSELWRDLGGSD
jgi:hypothetical protein